VQFASRWNSSAPTLSKESAALWQAQSEGWISSPFP